MNPGILKRAKAKQKFQIEHREFQKNLRLFINECMCRRESNQHKAEKLWKLITPHLKKVDHDRFQSEWKGHYIFTSEHEPDDLAYFIDEILNPYLT